MRNNIKPVCAALLLCAWFPPGAHSTELVQQPKPLLKKDCRLAVVDEGMTVCGQDMELYLSACVPDLNVSMMKFLGRGIADFKARIPQELVPFKPDVVTTSFGFGDAGYCPYNSKAGETYSKTLEEVVQTIRNMGATVLVGSSRAADASCFKGLRIPGGGKYEPSSVDHAAGYNQTLSKYTELGMAVAEKYQMPFADVHGTMCSVMEKAQAALGKEYDVCGADPKYPNPAPNGQLVIAYVLLKALGVDGDIGTISVDLEGGATATGGHKILSGDKGTVEIESTRYPFCFSGDEKSSAGTRSILPFLPFNQDLNRFLLVVRNLKSEKATVTWGNTSRSFPRKELESGVNLADAFVGGNPFSEPFKKVGDAVIAKQATERGILDTIASLKSFKFDAADAAFVEETCEKLLEKREAQASAVRSLVVPVRHKLTIAPANYGPSR